MPLADDVQLVSVNDHLVEPADLWTRRWPTRTGGDMPQVVDDGVESGQHWRIGEHRISVAGLAVIADPARGLPGGRAARVEEFHPAVSEPAARLVAMDEDGVQVHTLLPHLIGFAGERLRSLGGTGWSTAVRVYNDFLFEEFCAVDESRLVGVAILPLHDVAASVAELERAHAHGARGVSFPHDPVSLGLPSLYSGAWDPLFAVAQTAEMPVFVHIGTGGGPASANVDGPAPSVGTLLTLAGVDAMTAATDFVFSHVLTRHPRLEVALLEGGVAWLPYLSDRMAFFLRRDGVWPDDAELPSPMRLLERHVVASFIEDPTGLDLLPAIGASRVLWQSDFPHADSFWPGSRTHLARALADVPDGVARTIAETNARDLLGLHRP